MAASSRPKPRVFVDADVLFAGAASPGEHGASLVVLRHYHPGHPAVTVLRPGDFVLRVRDSMAHLGMRD